MLKSLILLTRQKREFKPVHAGEVGIRVWNHPFTISARIGHGRTAVAFDGFRCALSAFPRL